MRQPQRPGSIVTLLFACAGRGSPARRPAARPRRRNLAILLGEVPLLAIAIGALFANDVFDPRRDGNANDAAQVLFLLITTTFWLGAIAAAREIIKERAVVARERAAGVRLGAHLASKAAVLFALAAIHATALTAIVLAIRPLHESPRTYAAVLAILAATAIVAVAAGLVVSAIARSEDQAASSIPLLLVPQLLFAGAIVALSKMVPVSRPSPQSSPRDGRSSDRHGDRHDRAHRSRTHR